MIADRRQHTRAFELLRPGFDLQEESARKESMGLGWSITAEDLYADALPTLHRLRDDGYKVAVMANQPSTVEAFLITLPIDLYATSASWGVAKPDPEFFARVLRELDASPQSIAYVGDRVDNDVIPAKDCGMTAIHLRRGAWGVIQAQWPEARRADAQIHQLTELPHALRSLASPTDASQRMP